MRNCRLLVLLLLLVALPLNADRKKKRITHTPDVQPTALTVEDVVTIVEEEEEPQPDETQAVLVPQWGRYNKNNVALADPSSWKGRAQHKLDSLSNTSMFEASQLGLYVYDITTGEDIFAVNHRQHMRPASCEKLITAITALDCLGGNYQLRTDLRITGNIREDGVLDGNVFVVGRMDPMLAQGDVYAMARELKAQGVKEIKGTINMDTSFKDDNDYGWGWCWDDKWGPLRVLTVDGKDKFASEFLSDLASVGIKVHNASVAVANCPTAARLVYQCSHSIDQVLLTMMKDSNNIFAESLFYHIAAHGGGRGAGRKQAVAVINALIERLGREPSAYQIADGSGLSLYNYVTPQLFVNMLTYAWRNEKVRTHLYPTLPIAGNDGTLHARMTGSVAQDNVRAKTGTVDGISSLSGYLTSGEGHIIAFSIINQGVFPGSLGRDFQDKVCQTLCQ